MSNIVFYGDSITDCGRNRELDSLMGYGYPAIVTGKLSLENPEKDCFYNRGISGNRIVDLYAQINGVLNLTPDVISILIGVNDVWHKFSSNNGVNTAKFEKVYTLLLEEFFEKFPNVKIMILEPFLMRAAPIDSYYDEFRAEVEEKAQAARRVAEKFSLPFVELQSKFDKLYNPEKPTYWLRDGVHPTHAGHMLIANEWIETYNKYFKD